MNEARPKTRQVMCRISFGLAGIHFDELEICHPLEVLEEVYQPLTSHAPLIVGGKSSPGHCTSSVAFLNSVADGNLQGDATGHPALTSCLSSPTSPSLSTLSGEDISWQNTGRLKLTSSPARIITSSAPQNRKTEKTQKVRYQAQTGKVRGSTKDVIKEHPRKQDRSIGSASVGQHSSSPTTISPNKQVRFLDMIEQRTIPNDETSDVDSEYSSHSFTDPAPLSYKPKISVHGSSLGKISHFSPSPHVLKRMPRVSEYSPSGDSAVDAGIKWANAKVRDQHGSPAMKSSRTPKVASSSETSSDVDSNTDHNVQPREETRFRRQQVLSPLRSDPSEGNKTGDQTLLPEPVFIVRTSNQEEGNGG